MRRYILIIILALAFFNSNAQDATPPSGLQSFGGALYLRLSDTSVYAHYRNASGLFKFLRLPRYREFKPLTSANSTLTFSGLYNGLESQNIGLNLSNSNNWLAKQTITLNSSQLRLAYDNNNYADFSVSSIGNVSITPVGTGGTLTTRTVSVNGYNFTCGNEESNIEIPSAQSTDNTTNPLYILNNLAPSVSYRAAFGGAINAIVGTSINYATVIFKKTFVTKNPTGGTHNIFANVAINPLAITDGLSTLTNSASLFVNGAATNALNNYSIYSIGLNRMDTIKTNRLLLNGSYGIAGQTPRINSTGTMMEWVTPTYNTFTNGSIVFSNGSELSQDNSNFFWDNTSKRLGLGRTPTSARLEIEAPVNNYQAIKITPTTLANTYMVFERSTADPLNGLIIGNGISSANTPYTNASVIGTMGAKNETITLLSGYNASTSSTGDINLRGKTVFIGSAFTNDTSDSNLIQVANTYYSTGTVSLSGTTVTGTGTIFTPDMVGMTISITGLSWTTRTIIAYNSPTSLTVDVAGTVSGSLSYKIYNAGLQVTSNNSISINRKDASSFLHLGAGRTTIGNSPLKFTAGPTLTTPESGAVEFDGNHFYGTVGTARHQLDQQTYMHKYAASGNGVTTTIVIPHGLLGVNPDSMIWITPKNSFSGGFNYVSLDATNINIIYNSPPPSGTNNLSFDIQIKP